MELLYVSTLVNYLFQAWKKLTITLAEVSMLQWLFRNPRALDHVIYQEVLAWVVVLHLRCLPSGMHGDRKIFFLLIHLTIADAQTLWNLRKRRKKKEKEKRREREREEEREKEEGGEGREEEIEKGRD